MKYLPWTEEEIANYNRNYKREKLGAFYIVAGISNNKPHERFAYLVKKLNITELELKEISKEMKEGEDKGYHLGKLEDRAIMNFF
ncbi:MAG TPA: hypothetical protein VJA20_01230 [Candidatus Nanoarchaeia archaeon]|nr:hypothetical protein [Candidatus Nanoarchaeia archaeon]